MSRMGYGYGSECHLLRWMGRHRQLLEGSVASSLGIPSAKVLFLDFDFKPGGLWPDGELKGIDFLPDSHAARKSWTEFWPQTGNVPNWDAVAKLKIDGDEEWLLFEAKSHVEELHSSCAAKERGGLPQIRQAFQITIDGLGINAQVENWLAPYYQYANRLAVTAFLLGHGVSARLVNIYFVGDLNRTDWTCPRTIQEWQPPLSALESHLGLSARHRLAPFVHKLYLNVAGEHAT